MGIQPSASKTELVLACPRPFEDSTEAEPDLPGEAARYGSAFHQVVAAALRPKTRGSKPLEKTDRYEKEIERAAKKYNVLPAAAELAGHVKSSLGVLRKWLEKEELNVLEVEQAWGISTIGTDRAASRHIEPHDEDHRYDVLPGEIPGTVDLIAASENCKRIVVIDHKTGAYATTDFERPSKIPQMRTLGLVGVDANCKEPEVGIFHADRLGLPNIYVESYEKEDQQAHTAALHDALRIIGQGYIRPGDHCARCPMRDGCPAHRAELISESTEVLVRAANAVGVEPITGPLVPAKAQELAVEVRAGLLYDLIKKFEKLGEAGRAEVKRLVKGGSVVETRDGKTLAIRTQTFETLSMKSIREALGQADAEKMIKKLRKLGAVRESTREMLVGEK